MRTTRTAGRSRALVLAAALVGAAGLRCGETTSGDEGISCTADGDCMSGLRCLPFMVTSGTGCTSPGLECLQPCESDADCANLNGGFACLRSCPGTAACEPEMASIDAGAQ